MKIAFFFLMMLTCQVSLLAQTKEMNYPEIGDHIFKNYHPDSIALTKFCRIGCIFVKFKVNTQGEIANLSFSGDMDSTEFIKKGLSSAVNSLKQNITLINILRKSGRTIIQPVIYNYQLGCSFPKAASSGNTAKDSADFYLSNIMYEREMDHIYKSIVNILSFNDGSISSLDGTILSPIRVGSGSME